MSESALAVQPPSIETEEASAQFQETDKMDTCVQLALSYRPDLMLQNVPKGITAQLELKLLVGLVLTILNTLQLRLVTAFREIMASIAQILFLQKLIVQLEIRELKDSQARQVLYLAQLVIIAQRAASKGCSELMGRIKI